MAHYKIQEDVLNSLLQYLASKPYNEVATHIQAITQADVVVEEPKKTWTDDGEEDK